MYQDRRTLRGIGEIPLAPIPKPTITVTPIVPAATPTTTVKPTVWDTVNKVLAVGQQASDIYQNVKPTKNVTYTTTVLPDPSGSNPGTPSKSKVPIIVGSVVGVALLATGIYFVVRKKTKAKS